RCGATTGGDEELRKKVGRSLAKTLRPTHVANRKTTEKKVQVATCSAIGRCANSVDFLWQDQKSPAARLLAINRWSSAQPRHASSSIAVRTSSTSLLSAESLSLTCRMIGARLRCDPSTPSSTSVWRLAVNFSAAARFRQRGISRPDDLEK